MLYLWHQSTKLAVNAHKGREYILDTMNQTMMDKFLGFTDLIVGQNKGRYTQMNDVNVNNAMCIFMIDLIQ